MDSEYSEEEDTPSTEAPPKRGRPTGKVDLKPRYRRTAQEISDDKIKVAQMKLDAIRETEEKKLANRKSTRRPPPRAKAAIQETALPPAPVAREESPPPKRMPIGSRRQALYDSWFISSPRTRNY